MWSQNSDGFVPFGPFSQYLNNDKIDFFNETNCKNRVIKTAQFYFSFKNLFQYVLLIDQLFRVESSLRSAHMVMFVREFLQMHMFGACQHCWQSIRLLLKIAAVAGHDFFPRCVQMFKQK